MPVDQKAYNREYMRKKRAEAKARGEMIPSDQFARENKERWREINRRSYAKNAEKRRASGRVKQARRRSTPWGTINNRIWTVLHRGMAVNSTRWGKYNVAVGYTWATLRAHLEAQFAPDMTWENRGDVWELDHIRPVSAFHYTSLDDPLFKEAWALGNIRPLARLANGSAGGAIGANKRYGR